MRMCYWWVSQVKNKHVLKVEWVDPKFKEDAFKSIQTIAMQSYNILFVDKIPLRLRQPVYVRSENKNQFYIKDKIKGFCQKDWVGFYLYLDK